MKVKINRLETISLDDLCAEHGLQVKVEECADGYRAYLKRGDDLVMRDGANVAQSGVEMGIHDAIKVLCKKLSDSHLYILRDGNCDYFSTQRYHVIFDGVIEEA